MLSACRKAGALVLEVELAGPALRAELTGLEQLAQVARHVPASVMYVRRQHLDDAEIARRTGQLNAAEATLTAASNDDTGDPVVDADRMSQLRGQLEQTLDLARNTLEGAIVHQGSLASAELTLVAGGVAHDHTLTAAWMSELEDRFDDLVEALDLFGDPEEALTDEELEAQYARQAAQRQEREKERRRELETVGARLRHRLIGDLDFQQTAAADRRWKYAQRVLADEFGMDDLSQPDRGVLREHVDGAYRQITDDLVPSIRRGVIEALAEHAAHLTSQPAWRTATTLRSRTRIVREYLCEVHPLVATPALVEQVLAAAAGRADGQQQGSLL